MLSPEMQANILHLHFAKGEKIRAIARKLGVNRKSVERVINRKSVTVGIEPSARGSIMDAYKDRILEILKLDHTVPAKVILQRLRDDGFDGGYTIVRERVQALREELEKPKRKEAFFKLDFPPGQTAQIDWGEFGDVFGDGVKIHCFVMVLCYSRMLYVEFTRSEKFEEFIRCHENAFKYFDGLKTESCWYDNLPTAVSERMGPLTRFNARFLAYCGHHHIAPHACNLARGNEKGRVENGVKYVRVNFWPSRKFMDFSDLCSQASIWRDGTANLREHAETLKVPRLIFDSEEKSVLKKVNPHGYETDEVFSKEVRPDFHIIYETNQYSVPWTLVGLVVLVRIDATSIRIYYRERFITGHERSYLKNQKPFTKPEHEQGLLEIKPQGKNAHLTWRLKTLESYGESLATYLKVLSHNNRSLKQEVSRLLALGTIYGETQLATAVSEILKTGSVGVERIEMWLKNRTDEPKKPAPLNFDSDRLARIPARVDLRRYDEMIFKTESGVSSAVADDLGVVSPKPEGDESHDINQDPSRRGSGSSQ